VSDARRAAVLVVVVVAIAAGIWFGVWVFDAATD
jgi:hypothetical protein